MACSQGEKSVIKTNISFFQLGVLLGDSDKTTNFLQDSGLITNDTIKNVVGCKGQLHYMRNQIKLFRTF
jgi:hypothetical protein